jgi:hypothetical protein
MTDIRDSIINLTRKVTAEYHRQRRREEREAHAAVNRRTALVSTCRVSIKDAVFGRLRQAIEATSGGGRVVFPRRNLYYSLRKLIQRDTEEELSKTYFETLLAQWEKAHGQIEAMYCDPRGYFVEPHTGTKIPLGTREVKAYRIPAWRYDKILYVEKKGFHGLFTQAHIAERYDIGIMCAEGYSSEAGKLLLARAEQAARMTILCLHDADPYGYNIARKLRSATRAGCHVNVIDAGLKLQEALDLGLEPETFFRDRALPQGLQLNEVEREHFEGDWTGGYKGARKVYQCQRVELNDLASDPDRFIAYVEGKLQEHGCAGKLVPPRKVVLQHAKQERRDQLEAAVRAQVQELLNVDGLVRDIAREALRQIGVAELPAALASWSREQKPESWRQAIEQDIGRQVHALESQLRHQAARRAQGLSGPPQAAVQ